MVEAVPDMVMLHLDDAGEVSQTRRKLWWFMSVVVAPGKYDDGFR